MVCAPLVPLSLSLPLSLYKKHKQEHKHIIEASDATIRLKMTN